jgi:hypothetical protein
MKPYGSNPGTMATGADRPRSGMSVPGAGGDRLDMLAADTVRNCRRRLAKKARREALAEVRGEVDE